MWLERTKINDKVIAEEHQEAIENSNQHFHTNTKQKSAERLANEVNGQQCVIGKFGEIDIVTTTEVIEITGLRRAHAPSGVGSRQVNAREITTCISWF
jgi:hypothetical protein